MTADKNFQLGLLYFIHLLISADGVIDQHERDALIRIKDLEGIPDAVFAVFEEDMRVKSEKEIYQQGIALISECSEEEKLRTFVHLYKLSEVDGHVHIKEVRFLLYSIKMIGIEFNDVVERAAQVG